MQNIGLCSSEEMICYSCGLFVLESAIKYLNHRKFAEAVAYLDSYGVRKKFISTLISLIKLISFHRHLTENT